MNSGPLGTGGTGIAPATCGFGDPIRRVGWCRAPSPHADLLHSVCRLLPPNVAVCRQSLAHLLGQPLLPRALFSLLCVADPQRNDLTYGLLALSGGCSSPSQCVQRVPICGESSLLSASNRPVHLVCWRFGLRTMPLDVRPLRLDGSLGAPIEAPSPFSVRAPASAIREFTHCSKDSYTCWSYADLQSRERSG
jgi:hypothetical protein